jgi:two-component system, NarL family, response regulator DevR
LSLVTEGKTNKEIAIEMGSSELTVKSYLQNLYHKLRITRRAQAAAWFWKEEIDS